MRETIDEFLEFLNNIVRAICIILTAAMTLIVLLQVAARFLPMKPPTWTEELSRYTMIYIAFIGASNGIRHWNMIAVDFLLNRLPQKVRLIVDLIIRFAVLAFWILIVYLGVNLFPKVGLKQFSASMGFPLFYAQLSIIIGGIICALQTFGNILKTMIGGEENA